MMIKLSKTRVTPGKIWLPFYETNALHALVIKVDYIGFILFNIAKR